MASKKPLLIILTGLSTTNKTNFGLQLANSINGEVITADSPRLIRQLKILNRMGTLKSRIKLAKSMDGFQLNSPEKYAKLAFEEINAIHKRNKIPIVVGGTISNINSLISDNYVISYVNNSGYIVKQRI